jgi:8-oxo-dGTP pyrophosphatase MutT (NUDIX family)
MARPTFRYTSNQMMAFSGGVQAGETYEENAYRELAEELGISGVALEHLFKFYYEDDRVKVYGDAWECTYDGPVKLQEVRRSFRRSLSSRDRIKDAPWCFADRG